MILTKYLMKENMLSGGWELGSGADTGVIVI